MTIEQRVARLERLHDLHHARTQVVQDANANTPTAARQFVLDYAERNHTTYTHAETYLTATGRLDAMKGTLEAFN